MKYFIEESFEHIFTNVKMYRVKVIYDSGGIDYFVMTENELNERGNVIE